MFRGGELGRESHRPEHPQRVVAIGLFGFQRGPDDAGTEVADAAEGIYQRAEVALTEAESHRIDGKVPPQLVLFQGAVFHDRLAGFAVVGFLPRPHEFHLGTAVMQHRRSEIAEHAHVAGMFLAGRYFRGHGFRQVDAAPLHHDVDIIVLAAQEAVSHITADHESAHTQAGGHVAHEAEDRGIQESLCNGYRHISS